MEQRRFKKLIAVQLNKKFPVFYDLMEPKVRYCGDKSSILSQLNQTKTLFKITF